MGLSCSSIYFSTMRLPITQGMAHESHDNLCDLYVEAGRLFGGKIWTEKQVNSSLHSQTPAEASGSPQCSWRLYLRNVVLFPKTDWKAVMMSACTEDAQAVLLKCQCACESPGELLKHASYLSNQISFLWLPHTLPRLGHLTQHTLIIPQFWWLDV